MNSEAYLRKVVDYLTTEIGIRSYRNPDRLKRAADYISDEFNSFGYKTYRHSFLFRKNNYDNVIAELTGTASPEKILVVGAHYDTVKSTAGADDNASGVAVLLGLARSMSGSPQTKTVRFVSFALEEGVPIYRTKNMGSYHYARSLTERGEQVEGMICLEMLGYFSDREGSQRYPFPFMNRIFPKTGNFLAIVGNLNSKNFTRKIADDFRSAAQIPVITLNAPAIMVGIDFSDHWAFAKFGYRALMMTDTAFYRNPNYHKITDTADTLDYGRMAEIVKGIKAAVEIWGA